MPAKPGPSSIVVRMYNVGFGDCFLLTFRYPAAAKIPERHMLIDFGSSAAPRYGPKDYLQRVALPGLRNDVGGVLLWMHQNQPGGSRPDDPTLAGVRRGLFRNLAVDAHLRGYLPRHRVICE